MNTDDQSQDDFGEPPLSLYDTGSAQDYDAALDVAARLRLNLAAEAAADARIYAVGEMGAVQIIGTGRAWPSNADVVLQGPCILVYGKDVDARATEILAELGAAPEAP